MGNTSGGRVDAQLLKPVWEMKWGWGSYRQWNCLQRLISVLQVCKEPVGLLQDMRIHRRQNSDRWQGQHQNGVIWSVSHCGPIHNILSLPILPNSKDTFLSRHLTNHHCFWLCFVIDYRAVIKLKCHHQSCPATYGMLLLRCQKCFLSFPWDVTPQKNTFSNRVSSFAGTKRSARLCVSTQPGFLCVL